jgi:hypothetical protein
MGHIGPQGFKRVYKGKERVDTWTRLTDKGSEKKKPGGRVSALPGAGCGVQYRSGNYDTGDS